MWKIMTNLIHVKLRVNDGFDVSKVGLNYEDKEHEKQQKK